MSLRDITDFILQSRVHTCGTAMVCALPGLALGSSDLTIAFLVASLSMLSLTIAALVTLKRGILEGALVTIIATSPIVIGDLESLPNFSLSGSELLILMVASNVFTWVFASILRVRSSWSELLQVAGALSIAAVVGAHVIYPDIDHWWELRLTSYFANTLQILGQLNVGDVQAETAVIDSIVISVKPYITGAIVSFVACMALLQVLIARAWQSVVYEKGSLRKELLHIRMGYSAGVVFVIALVWSYLGGDMATDVMPILYFIFGLAGFSVMHYKFADINHGWLYITICYTVITFVGMMPIAMFALLDTWLNFRERKSFFGF